MDLLVLAKEPVPGRVKTRLVPPCTPEEAAALAEAALADTLHAAMACRADRVVLALDGRPGSWCPPGVEVVPQGTGDLAQRLEAAWRAVRGPALQIGMDTPEVTAPLLDDAFARLERPGTGSVLGLAEDGGWWAIGLRGPVPGCFAGIETSRDDTGARQLARLHELALGPALLPVLRDVDRWEDVEVLAPRLPGTAFAAAARPIAARLGLASVGRRVGSSPSLLLAGAR